MINVVEFIPQLPELPVSILSVNSAQTFADFLARGFDHGVVFTPRDIGTAQL
jgi:hypothetical protein